MRLERCLEVLYKLSLDEDEKDLLIMSLRRMISNYGEGTYQHDKSLEIKKQLEELK